MKIISLESGAYFVGPNARFCVKPMEIAGHEFSWSVHDADWITDAERREGKRSPAVGQFHTLGAAFQFCRLAIKGEPTKPIGLTWETTERALSRETDRNNDWNDK